MRQLMLALMLSLSLSVPSFAAPDPVKDCPKGLVCLTVQEAKNIEKRRAALEYEVKLLRASRPRIFGGFYSVGLTQGLGNDASGGYGSLGGYVGPVSIGVTVSEYGFGVEKGITLAYSKRF